MKEAGFSSFWAGGGVHPTGIGSSTEAFVNQLCPAANQLGHLLVLSRYLLRVFLICRHTV